MIVATRRPATEALQRLRSDDFDPSNRVRYNIRAFKYVNAFVADLDESEIAALKQSPEVEYIEEDPERHALADGIIAGQQTVAYGVNLVQAPRAWLITRGRSIDPAKPIRVAIIDTGIDYTASELAPNFKGGINIVGGGNDPLDDAGHGTHVAGIIAAADNGAGVVGVAPQVELYSAKVLDSCGSGSGSGIIAAIEWVRDQKKNLGGNWVVNLSLGSNRPNATERTAFQQAADEGILVFAASGNDYPTATGLSYPAGYSSVVSVGAVDETSTIASFSQRGTGLHVVAPGVLNLSTFVGEQLSTNDGRHFDATLATPADQNDKAIDSGTYCPAKPVFSGTFVFCGTGGVGEFPASVAGKIALIQRGNNINFSTKLKNAIEAGATGVIIFNNQPPDAPEGQGRISPLIRVDPVTGQLPAVPVIMLLQPDGESLKATPDATVSVGFDFHGFALLSGTSMACPHAVGVAALAWSVAPSLKNTDIADAMQKTAIDLGDAGVDNTYGYGLVNAKAVVDMLNSGNPVQPPPPPTGRAPGRRGH